MTKSHALFILIMDLTSMLPLAYANESASEDKSLTLDLASGSFNEDILEDSDDEDEQNPEMNCLLFGHVGCHIECILTIEVYYYNDKTYGICDGQKRCVCHYKVSDSFYTNWTMRFESNNVYYAILKDKNLFQDIHEIFQYPKRTVAEFKKILKPMLSPHQYHNLIARDRGLAAKFTADGKIREDLIKEYVSEKLTAIFQSPFRNILFDVDYQKNLRDALNNIRSKSTLHNVTDEIRRMKNKILENILHEYLTARSLEEPKIEFKKIEDLCQILSRAIINEIIERKNEPYYDDLRETSVVNSIKDALTNFYPTYPI